MLSCNFVFRVVCGSKLALCTLAYCWNSCVLYVHLLLHIFRFPHHDWGGGGGCVKELLHSIQFLFMIIVWEWPSKYFTTLGPISTLVLGHWGVVWSGAIPPTSVCGLETSNIASLQFLFSRKVPKFIFKHYFSQFWHF